MGTNPVSPFFNSTQIYNCFLCAGLSLPQGRWSKRFVQHVIHAGKTFAAAEIRIRNGPCFGRDRPGSSPYLLGPGHR